MNNTINENILLLMAQALRKISQAFQDKGDSKKEAERKTIEICKQILKN